MSSQATIEALDLSIDPAALDFSTPPANPSDEKPDRQMGPPRPTKGKTLSLSLLLRGLGGLVIVAAFVMYLFQGWREGDDLTRSLLLLAHTAILTLAGFASGHLLHEAKGARLFIALALAAVPVNFAYLGGLSYEQLTWDAPLAMDASASFWTASVAQMTAGSALLVTAGSVLGLALATWVGFLIMARRSAWPLTALYLLANAALLVPTRADAAISAMLIGLGLTIGTLIIRVRRRDPSLATPEGLFARAVLLLPLLVLGGRSLWLYAPDALFFTTLSIIAYLGLRLAIVAAGNDARWRSALELLAVLTAAVTTFLAFHSVIDARAIPDVVKVPLTAGVFAGLLVDLSTLGSRWQGHYRGAAALVATLAMLLNLTAFGGFGNALTSLAIGIATLAYGYASKGRFIFVMGLITALAGLGFAAQDALSTFTIGGWSALVLLGISTILAGSVVERHGAEIKAGLLRWHQHFEHKG
ncbi:hypothetical protein G3480_19405 [Thiorhodococcus mannitoliphagus]|uniref:DUF2157 domain-containing protein n=1 Tax=Thiorhodococcus mannitoliphagus TaxID=329406 RepID=A0A6P1E087_9GAMM|nr:hypothetical protein [Thiorhodococcus mannitoliphagus]NEX22446.1 hypothetical protein [Thiorhodococcus mannitoliphagus]